MYGGVDLIIAYPPRRMSCMHVYKRLGTKPRVWRYAMWYRFLGQEETILNFGKI